MSAENIISRLDKARKTGADKWQACCPAHDDKGPSLAIRELDDGRVLLHCFAGCGASEILFAIGMTFADLYPENQLSRQSVKPVRKPWSASDALTGIAFECLILLQYANSMATGKQLTNADRARLLLSATRIQRAREVTL